MGIVVAQLSPQSAGVGVAIDEAEVGVAVAGEVAAEASHLESSQVCLAAE